MYYIRVKLNNYRPPGTLVPKALCFTADVFFIRRATSRAPSADRRETLPHDRNMGVLYNASPQIRGPLLPKKLGPKTCKIRRDFRQLQIRSRISPERVKISKIGKRKFPDRFLPRSTKKVR